MEEVSTEAPVSTLGALQNSVLYESANLILKGHSFVQTQILPGHQEYCQ